MPGTGITPLWDVARRRMRIRNEYVRGAIGELLGTAILLFFVCGAGMQHFVQKGNDSMQPTLGQMFGLLAAILITGGASGAHFNPAVTVGLAIVGECKWRVIPLYAVFQLLGAYLGAGLAAAVYYWIPLREGKTFPEYFTDPNVFSPVVDTPIGSGYLDQIITTCILNMTIAACVDKRNMGVPKYLIGLYLILTVSAIIMCFGVNAGAALNPVRDLGPRLMAVTLGYDSTLIFMNNDGKTHWWTVGIFGPMIGGVLGSYLYLLLIGIHLDDPEEVEKVEDNNNNNNNNNDVQGWRATHFVPKAQMSPVIPQSTYDEAPPQYPQTPQNIPRQHAQPMYNGNNVNNANGYRNNANRPSNFNLREDMRQRQGY